MLIRYEKCTKIKAKNEEEEKNGKKKLREPSRNSGVCYQQLPSTNPFQNILMRVNTFSHLSVLRYCCALAENNMFRYDNGTPIHRYTGEWTA